MMNGGGCGGKFVELDEAARQMCVQPGEGALGGDLRRKSLCLGS